MQLISANPAKLFKQIEQITNQLRAGQTDRNVLTCSNGIDFDCDPSWIRDLLRKKAVHDSDFQIFGRLPSHEGIVLDIGANWGYGAASMISSGCQNSILSFEVLPHLAICLSALKEERGGKYDFVTTGVAGSVDQIEFYTPLLGRHAITALTTAKLPNFTPEEARALADNLADHARRYMSLWDSKKLRVLRTMSPVQTIDAALEGYSGTFNPKNVVAIKIDVEGLEDSVLRGASDTVGRNRPILLIEGGTRNNGVGELLDLWGYQGLRWAGSKLEACSGLTTGTNGTFYHPKGHVPRFE